MMKRQKAHRSWKIRAAIPTLAISIGVMNAVVCLAATAAPRQSEAPSRSAGPRLVLAWVDPEGLFSLGSKTLGLRVRGIFEDIGIQTDWREGLVAPSADSNAVHVRVVLVATDPSGWGLSGNAMGVVLSRTTPQDAVYIFFQPVARALGHRPQKLMKRGLSVPQSRIMARALSRVVAHEVIHAVAPKLAHGPKGLTHGELDQACLSGPHPRIHPLSADIFRSELTRLAMEGGPAPRENPRTVDRKDCSGDKDCQRVESVLTHNWPARAQ